MYHQILSETARKIFEEAAFAFVDSDGEGPAEMQGGVAMEVDFSGPFNGGVAILVPEKAARVAAANMLALDEGSDEAAKRAPDAVGEILNMICGNVLPAIAGSGPEFKIGAPRMIGQERYGGLFSEGSGGRVSEAKIFVEGCEVSVAMFTDGTA